MESNLKITLFFVVPILIILVVLPLFFSKIIKEDITFIASTNIEEVKDILASPQKFHRFNGFIREDSLLRVLYYYPYEGVEASVEWNYENFPTLGSMMQIAKITPNSVFYDAFLSDIDKFLKISITIRWIDTEHTELRIAAETEEIPYFQRYFNYYTRIAMCEALEKIQFKMTSFFKNRSKKIELAMRKPGSIQKVELFGLCYAGKTVDLPNDFKKFTEFTYAFTQELDAYFIDSLGIPEHEYSKDPVIFVEDIALINTPKSKSTPAWMGFKLFNKPKKLISLTTKTIEAGNMFIMFSKGKFGFLEKIASVYENYFSKKNIESNRPLVIEINKIPPIDTLDFEFKAISY